MFRIAPLRTRILLIWFGLFLVIQPAFAVADTAKENAALAAAMKLADQKDWEGATAQAMSAGRIGADVVEWSRLRDGDGYLGDYEAFLGRHPDWPGLVLLKEKGEAPAARSTDPARIIAYFGRDQPRTADGCIALAKALAAVGRQTDAVAEATRGWSLLKFSADQETALLAQFAPGLRVADDVRLDRILWDGNRTEEARRMIPRVSKDWAKLAAARLALRADADGVSALVAAVPKTLSDDAGLAYERFLYRMRLGGGD